MHKGIDRICKDVPTEINSSRQIYEIIFNFVLPFCKEVVYQVHYQAPQRVKKLNGYFAGAGHMI